MKVNVAMEGFKAAIIFIIFLGIGLLGLNDLLKPVSNGCVMTYMYPQYIPVSAPANVSSSKYGLYLYHEGWKRIDYNEHLKKLSGVPVLFIPGNGGSYKQVRSLAAESDRVYQGGPPERTFYRDASFTLEDGVNINISGVCLPNQYVSKLDWFAVDLDGEHSAMDSQILEEHTEYVVYAIHRILDHYKASRDALKKGTTPSGSLPKSVILVGHSMGGFVARAAIVHPNLRKSAVETVLTISSPHQSPPLALQPSLSHYYEQVNQEWRRGYEVQTSRTGQYVSDPPLSRIVVVSISGGFHDYQVRTQLESLDGIVPPTHGFTISSTAMKNVWLSMEHQVILWCNQLVVQVSHTILSLVDPLTGKPFFDTSKRLTMFVKMLHSGIPESFNWSKQFVSPQLANQDHAQEEKEVVGSSGHTPSSCLGSVHWNDDDLEKDLYIHTTSVTVLVMDGKRRWLDIEKLGSNGRSHFVLVTNLAPCSGIRLHLWPAKAKSTSEMPLSRRVVEVTEKMVRIPSGPAPRQTEPGSQTEQAPPSSVFLLTSQDTKGFRFLTISVAPRLTVSGRPPPAASMAVGQFFSPNEAELHLSPLSMLLSVYSPWDTILKEDHPLAFNMSFAVSLGVWPITLSLKTTGCGIKKSALPVEEAEDFDITRLCKLRCFPPVALAWDTTSGLHVFPNLLTETILVDSSPGLWSSTKGSEKTSVLLLVDPHCSYEASASVSYTAAAKRFLLMYWSEISGLTIAVVFFALMRQAHAWEIDLPIPSMLSAVEANLSISLPSLSLAIVPLFIAPSISFLMSQPFHGFVSFFLVSVACYLFSNGFTILLILISQSVFYVAAVVHVFMKTRCRFVFFSWFLDLSSRFLSFKVVRVARANPSIVIALVSVTFVCFIHPCLGLFVLLLSHVFSCHTTLSSFITVKRKESSESKTKNNGRPKQHTDVLSSNGDSCSSSPGSARSFGETKLEVFDHRHGLFILHLLATLMFVPSLIAWSQRIGTGRSFPCFIDLALCTGVILHGICDSKPEFNFFLFPFLGNTNWEVKLSFAYLLAGYYAYISALALVPSRAFYSMAAIGFVSFVFRIIQRRNREKGVAYFSNRKHSHRH